jgi:ATP-dependent DNA helicase RecG
MAGTTLADLDMELLCSTYLPTAIDAEVPAENHRQPADQLASLRLCSIERVPTACGLLVGGFDPSSILPGAYVQFVRYEGDGQDSSILDEKELPGNLVAVMPALESLAKANIRNRLKRDGFREHALPDYPLDALRELLSTPSCTVTTSRRTHPCGCCGSPTG